MKRREVFFEIEIDPCDGGGKIQPWDKSIFMVQRSQILGQGQSEICMVLWHEVRGKSDPGLARGQNTILMSFSGSFIV